MNDGQHRTEAELEAGFEEIARSPRDSGLVEMIVRRPEVNRREVLETADLDPEHGLLGDNWGRKGSSRTPDGSAHLELQLTLMNARVIALLAPERERWPLAGDQIYVDLDLSAENLPAGTRLAVGSAIIEVTAPPHTGCKKFRERFGADALQFVNSARGKAMRLRGVNARVVQGGTVRRGDRAKKLAGTKTPA